jgi:hypothetical protein
MTSHPLNRLGPRLIRMQVVTPSRPFLCNFAVLQAFTDTYWLSITCVFLVMLVLLELLESK